MTYTVRIDYQLSPHVAQLMKADNQICITPKTRYIRYIVDNQALNPLQLRYMSATPATSLILNNLNQTPWFLAIFDGIVEMSKTA